MPDVKAIMCTKYGPPEVLQLQELEMPEPRHDQVRIRVRATAVTSSDCIVRGFKVPIALWLLARLVLGIRRPRKILGMVLAGDVDAIAGLTAFTRMPRLMYSRAAVRVRPTTPCLEAIYEAMPGTSSDVFHLLREPNC